MRPWLVLVLIVLTGALSVSAQAPPQTSPPATQTPDDAQAPTFRTGVGVITVDVSAVDRAGRPVSDLRAADFAVRIDGQPRRVVSIQPVTFDAAAARRQQAADPFESFFSTNQGAPNSRLIVIAVDQLNIQPGSARTLLQTAARFLDTLAPQDRVAFFAYPAPGASIDFTTDRDRVRQAMELTVGSAQRFEAKFNIGLYEAIQSILRDDEVLRAAVFARECRRTSGQAYDECVRQVTSEMALMVNRVREDRLRSVGSLERLLEALALVDAPKSLILLSEGLVISDESDMGGVMRAAARARTSIDVLYMDVPRGSDLTRGAVMPPTMTEDRALQTDGLRALASAARGSLYTVVGNGTSIFDRLGSELSAYYLIGVEEEPGDRDDRTHRIDVEVRRQGVTLRSRRAFVLSTPRSRSPSERLTELLQAPYGVSEVPLRATTFAVQDTASTKVRLLLAAEVDQAGSPAGAYTVGWTLVDRDGRVAASAGGTVRLEPAKGAPSSALEFRAQTLVEPGVYSLRLAVVDQSGRRGALVREVNAWKMAGEAFAVADLVVGAPPETGSVVLANVEPHLATDVAAVVELYADGARGFDAAAVTFEIADSANSAALVSLPGEILNGDRPTARAAQAVFAAPTLPAGRYVMRARITRAGTVVGVLARPFVLEGSPEARRTTLAPPAVPTALAMPRVPAFDRALTLTPDIVGDMLSLVERRSPALKAAVSQAKAGRYAAAALDALGEGDQEAAAFLKGMDLYTRGQLDQAAVQFNVAAGARRTFFPAAFFLGATLASAGRDRDAASVWQLGIGVDPRPPLVYALFADARLRDQQPQSVVDVLQPVWQRNPADAGTGRRLALALVATAKYAESLPVLAGYLQQQPGDHEVLLVAIAAQYEATTRSGVPLSPNERARLDDWAVRYQGPQRPLVDRYLTLLR